MRFIAPCLALMPLPVLADVPNVVTDIAPVHSLVAQVMEGVGSPDVLVSGGTSPHDFQFTFTQAESVQNADLVVWIGQDLTPWLEESLDTLAQDTARVTLLDTDGWTKRELRDWDDGHDHGHDDHEDDYDDDHDGHEDHADDHDAHDDHDDHSDHDDHDTAHMAVDPHAWLDPQVAMVWTDLIAARLGEIDPENADLYRANAQETIERLAQLDSDIETQLATLPRNPLLVPHDAYQYFGTRYDLVATGAITLNDAAAPSPAKIDELQTLVRDQNVSCVLSDPQSRATWVDLVREGSDARTALADPIGTTIEIGPDHYDQTLRSMADAYAACLAE